MHPIPRDAARLILLILLLTVAGIASAHATPAGEALGPPPEFPLEQLVARKWTTRDGLPSDNLNDVASSADGYLWASTYAGLVRFDGRTFTTFVQRDVPALSTSGFLDLHRDPAGHLWIGTQGDGPWVYDGSGLSPHDPERRLPKEVVSLLLDRQGTLWIGLEELGVYRYNGTGPVLVEDPAIADVQARALYEDHAGALWFGTRGNGVVRLEDGRFRTFSRKDGLLSNSVRCLAEGAPGIILVGQPEGLSRIDGEEITQDPHLVGVQIYDLLYDRHGSLWIATSEGLMRRRAAHATLEVLTQAAGTRLGAVTALTFDHEGNLWLATSTQGLFQLRRGKFTNYELGEDRTHGVHEISPGEVLVGAEGGDVYRIHRGQVSSVPLKQSLDGARVMDVRQDRDGHLWFSTYDGLLRQDGTDQRLFTLDDGLPSLEVRWSYEDRRGRFWVGTGWGVARRQDDGSFAVAEELGPAATGISFSVTEHEDGRLFFSTRQGLVIYAPSGETTLYKSGEDFPGSLVFNARVAADGKVWICTNGGLARLDERGITSVTWRAGLPAEAVFDLQEDDLGSLWLSSAIGVIRLPKQELEAYLDGERPRVEAELFDEWDGMANAECTGARKILKARDGTLWFPTLRGVAVLDPVRLPRNPVAPPVFITGFSADGEKISLRGEPRIPPGRRRLDFDFAALSLQNPFKTRIQIRLEGFDPDWVEAGHERRISYTNLRPGSYTLRVIAANGDGVWNRQGAALDFHVAPRFYQTIWFNLLSALLILAATFVVYRWRVRAVRAIHRRNAQLEEDARERTRLIEELAAKNRELELFAYTASHDLKSPLITIEGFLGLVEQDVRAGNLGRMEKDMGRIRSGIQTMGRLLDGLLEVSQIGRKDEAPISVDLEELANKAVEICHAQIMASGAEVIVAPDLPRVVGSPSRLVQVFQNLLANAAKFMGDQAKPRIEIGRRRDGTELVLFVKDNGLGIAPEFHERIFGLFDRLNPKEEGNGLGLAIVKRVIEVHGGKVWVESKGVGQGSTFCFTLDSSRVLSETN